MFDKHVTLTFDWLFQICCESSTDPNIVARIWKVIEVNPVTSRYVVKAQPVDIWISQVDRFR